MKSGYELSVSRLIGGAMRGALQWRLLALFTVIALLPTTVAAFPMWRVLARVLDNSPRAKDFAAKFDALAFQDMWIAIDRSAPALGGAMIVATLLAMLSWPLLAGLAVTAARAERSLGFVDLLHGGTARYTRMLRLGAVAIVPFAMVGGAGALVYSVARRHAENAILESQAKLGYRLAFAITLIVFVVLHATLEAGRGALGADDRLASGFRAWVRGVKLVLRAPLRVLAVYLACTLASYGVASVLLVVRIRVNGDTAIGFTAAFLLTQLSVAALGFGRVARLFGMTSIASSRLPMNYLSTMTPSIAEEDSPRAVAMREAVSRSG